MTPDEQAEQAWQHAEEHHPIAEDNASLAVDYLRAIAAELRAIRISRTEEDR